MRLKYSTFRRITLFIFLLLIPIMVLYAMSNRVSVQVLTEEVTSLKQKDLDYFANDINKTVDSISTLGFILSQDIHIQKLRHLHLLETKYELTEEKLRMLERLQLLNVTGTWDTQYSIMSPENEQIISTSSTLFSYDLDMLRERYSPVWEYKTLTFMGSTGKWFLRHIVKPVIDQTELENAGLIVELSFREEDLVRELDQFKVGGSGDPFLYGPGGEVILNRTANSEMVEQITQRIREEGALAYSNRITELNGEDYLIGSREIPSLGWYVVDYIPLQSIVQPIHKSRNLFYGSMALLLVMSVVAAYLLYKNVQRPIVQLIRGVQKLKMGDYSARITSDPKNEFTFLFHRFNEMAAETEQLIQKVYVEEIRAREANLKQLQSQINPHFLYNCFALIRSLTRLNKKDSVMELVLHLSKYYRYTTRVEKQSASLKEELDLVESYLKIQQLHIQHLRFEMHVPSSMWNLEIPRLLLQPLVENAVLHGVEPADSDGLVQILGEESEAFHCIHVIDNGVGLTESELVKLEKDIHSAPTEETGCALWNIQQRLRLQFGDQAKLLFKRRAEGGLKVTVQWPKSPHSIQPLEIERQGEN